jgi:hypothetical protein
MKRLTLPGSRRLSWRLRHLPLLDTPDWLEKIFLFEEKEDLFQLGQTHLFVAGNQPAC